jgi:hypothetical protein
MHGSGKGLLAMGSSRTASLSCRCPCGVWCATVISTASCQHSEIPCILRLPLGAYMQPSTFACPIPRLPARLAGVSLVLHTYIDVLVPHAGAYLLAMKLDNTGAHGEG